MYLYSYLLCMHTLSTACISAFDATQQSNPLCLAVVHMQILTCVLTPLLIIVLVLFLAVGVELPTTGV